MKIKLKKYKTIEIIDNNLNSEESFKSFNIFIITNNSFNEKVVRKAITSTLPIGSFEAQVEFPNQIKAISANIEIEHGILTITLKKSNIRKILEII
ncbi:unnamed protein product [Rhizophagus irregularis]|nr:unnamed protein product [Rhizophagus irregularis]CAB4413212.1 unnamed protein product [Rhizophagus irregularis]